ncbi:MAG: DUF2309 family protein [Deltaproteobacteria bacterium]|nr:DUF2309 family protein [Deltaproteobacteria bacterium]
MTSTPTLDTDEPLTRDTQALRAAVDHVAHLLPAQGPISVFIHHNLLHAFEGARFEDAVTQAARIYGAEPYWPADRYRALFETGRITHEDLSEVVDESLGERGAERIAGITSRRELALATTRYGVRAIRGQALEWHLHEEGAIRRFRMDLPPTARAAIAATGAGDAGEIASAVGRLWEASVAAIGRAPPFEDAEERPRRTNRHRDAVLDETGIDLDDEVHPALIRFVSAYLDQGLSLWPMLHREDGLFLAFLQAYRHRSLAPFLGPWGPALLSLLDEEATAARDGLASLAHSLDVLGVDALEQDRFLLETALALKGWAGMVHQLEQRPDRAPVWPVPARLVDFLAVRLLLERAVLTHVAKLHKWSASLAVLREELSASAPRPPPSTVEARAFAVFQLAQLLGLGAERLASLSGEDIAELERVIAENRRQHERRWLHAAYEVHLRRRLFDALTTQAAPSGLPAARFQAVFCVDEREESIRRHLEEVDAHAETASTAGFFGVAMYHKGARDARPRPLAPVVVQPRHYVPFEARGPGRVSGLARDLGRLRAQTLHVGSRSLLRGALVSLMGAISLLPLVLRILSPRRFGGEGARAQGEGRLLVDHVEGAPPIGDRIGYTVEEMAEIVGRVLAELSLGGGRLARLVVICGHAADSLNNPHRSAYECGACGGGPGGPSARAFAMMANRPAVRKILEATVPIPDTTVFVAAEHNTTDDSVTWFDVDDLPTTHADDFTHARASFEEACRRNAEERCRRFAQTAMSTRADRDAIHAVRARRWDLAEPRPEYNHATNAFAIIGRRARTRGLFLDRRAFLVSYDPTCDDSSSATLKRILGAVIPVLAGINLEYFFGAIDNEVYGAGTKLPHNVAGLIGVMNGAQGDLRTGLWAQTVEIHEPVRLTVVIETTPERLEEVIASSELLSRLVKNRWLFLAALSPEDPALHDFSTGAPRPYAAQKVPLVVHGTSGSWFRGKRGHLGFAQIHREAEE